MNDVQAEIPGPVVRRFPRYLTLIREMKQAGQQWVSSRDLSTALGVTTSTIRQDMSHLDVEGVPKRGYDITTLEAAISGVMGANVRHPVVIIGAGLLGRALALHGEWAQNGFDVCAIFDRDATVIGTDVGTLTVRPMEELKTIFDSDSVDIGVLAVPPASAQSVADQLVAAGASGILNLSHAHLEVPDGVAIVEARILARLQELAYAVRSSPNGRRLSG